MAALLMLRGHSLLTYFPGLVLVYVNNPTKLI